jgi:hypothetical protein
MSTQITREKIVEHPLEDVLDITPCTTVVEYTETVPAVAVPMANYDAKDDEIEEKLEEIYTIAMDQVQTLGDEIERVEGKYKARMGEVSATMLNVALGAVREKSALKMHKDKLTPVAGSTGARTVNNTLNVVTADRNELLRLFIEQQNKS